MSYLSNAESAFQTLAGIWNTWLDGQSEFPVITNDKAGFWHVANSLDTGLHYAHVAMEKDPAIFDATDRANLGSILNASLNTFNAAYNAEQSDIFTYWWDDFGWWGNAFVTAYNFLDQHPGVLTTNVTADECLTAAKQAWQTMTDHGWNGEGWVNTCQPKLTVGGCWNHPPATCSGGSGSGKQNAVTNGVYEVLCLRLYKADKAASGSDWKTYLQYGCDEYNWLVGQIGGWTADCLGANPGMIKSTPTSDGHIWTGNQGLWLAGWIHLWKASDDFQYVNNPPSSSQIESFVKVLAAAASTSLFDSELVLHEAPFEANYGGDPVDLATGKGVFMRYLANVSEELRTHFSNPAQPHHFGQRMRSTADKLWSQPKWTLDSQSVIPLPWNPSLNSAFQTSFQASWGATCVTSTDYSWDQSQFDSSLGATTVQTAALGALLAAAAVS